MEIFTLDDYSKLKADTIFEFECKQCHKVFSKRKRRGQRGQNFNFLCQKCGRTSTNIQKYGCENVFSNDIIKDKIKNTNIEKYGVDNPAKSSKIQEKIKDTCLMKYNVEYSFQSDNNKDKTKKFFLEKYGVEHPSQVKEIKDKMVETWKQHKEQAQENYKKTMLERYGVEYPYQNYDVQTKGKKKYLYDGYYFDSSWELAFYIYCVDNNIPFSYHPAISFEYTYNGDTYKYFPDFKVNDKIIEIKGLQFFENKDPNGKMINPFDRGLDDKFEAKHKCMIQNNVRIITDCSKYIDYVNKKYTVDFLELFSTKIPFPYPNSDLSDTSDMGLIHHFHKSIYDATRKGKISPKEAWNNKDIVKKVALNRLKYKGKCTPYDVLQGFNVTRIANKVSVFKPKLAEDLIRKYLNDCDSIFDPFSGFSGRMLGAIRCSKDYFGQDINEDHVRESNEILKYINKQGSNFVFIQDILKSNGHDFGNNTCLFTCPPYGGKEHWNTDCNEAEKSCDEWIDICIKKYKCKKYLFVVDKTEKYKDYIIDTIVNKSHFSNNKEYIILI